MHSTQALAEVSGSIQPENKAVVSASAGSGADLIAAERRRQIEQEGWGAANDDNHTCFQLTEAAIAYADHARGRAWLHQEGNVDGYQDVNAVAAFLEWPDDWDAAWFKPTSPIRDLVKAGALIAAEIDRLQRLTRQGS